MKNKTLKNNKYKKSRISFLKPLLVLAAFGLVSIFIVRSFSQPADINLISSRLGGGDKGNDNVATKLGGATSKNSETIRPSLPNPGKTVPMNDETTEAPAKGGKTTPAVNQQKPLNDGNPFSGSAASGGTKTNLEKAKSQIEDKLKQAITVVEDSANLEISSLNNDKATDSLTNKPGRCTGSECVVSTPIQPNQSGSPDERQERNDSNKLLTEGQLSPDKNPIIARNCSGSPDERQTQPKTNHNVFENLIKGTGYKGTDDEGNQIQVNTKTQTLENGYEYIVTTRTVTAPSGNAVTINTAVTKNQQGETIDTKSVTVTKTKNPDGTYGIITENLNGETRFSNVQRGTSTTLSPDSKDKGTQIICPAGHEKINTSRGLYCASPASDNCDNMGFKLNGRCYWIGEEVSPGNEVCDWTVGGRKGVNYPFLSTNCPTKSESSNNEARTKEQCGSGENAGWWSDVESKCYRPGELVRLDKDTKVPVCRGGRIGLEGTCPEYVATGDSGNLGADKNSGQFSPTFPMTTNTDGTLSPDKQSNQFDPPKACNFNIQCSADGTTKCSNDNKFWSKGICTSTNPTLSPDKQSGESGGMGVFVQKPNGKTDEVVDDASDCMLAGAKRNNVGKYICPALDGTTNPALENTLCEVNLTRLSGYSCLLEGTVYRILNPSVDKPELDLEDSQQPAVPMPDSATDPKEGDTCIDLAGNGATGIWQAGRCNTNISR